MKKCLLTGHTSGLGKAILEYLTQKGWPTEGCSRQNGFDISSSEDRAKLIEKSLEFDVFINNAMAGYSQTELLFEIFNCWKKCGKRGRIVSIGSRAAIDYKFRQSPPVFYDYQKVSLRALNETLSLQNDISLSCIHFGYIGTDAIKERPDLVSTSKLDVKYAAEVVFWVVSQPENVIIPEIQVRAMTN